MNIELKPIAESKVRQLGGDVFGVLVRTDDGVMAVSEHGRCTRLDAGVMGPVESACMSDMRDEFEAAMAEIFDINDEAMARVKAMRHVDEEGTECYQGWEDDEAPRTFSTAWLVWKRARAQGGQGAELDEYQKFDQKLCQEVFEKLNAEFDKDPKGGITVYTEDWRASVHHLKRLPRQNIGTIGYANTQPQPAVPECPYPCGWDNLFKIIVENAANFARSTLDDEVPESVRQMGIDSGQYAIHLCKLAMKVSGPATPQPTAEKLRCQQCGNMEPFHATGCETEYGNYAPATPQADGWVSMADRHPTKSDEDCEGKIWLLWPDRRYFERVLRGSVLCSPEFFWMPTGLKRPQPPKQEGESDE